MNDTLVLLTMYFFGLYLASLLSVFISRGKFKKFHNKAAPGALLIGVSLFVCPQMFGWHGHVGTVLSAIIVIIGTTTLLLVENYLFKLFLSTQRTDD